MASVDKACPVEGINAEHEVGHLPVAAAVLLVAAGCGSSSSSDSSSSSSPGSSTSSTTNVLVGAGSTLVAPLMAQWQPDYAKSDAAVTVTYGAIGSGGGVDAVTAPDGDSARLDAPLTCDQATACKGCLQCRRGAGRDRRDLQRRGCARRSAPDGQDRLAECLRARCASWDDAQIERDSTRGVNLPSTHVAPIYRTDSSGGTSLFTARTCRPSIPRGSRP